MSEESNTAADDGAIFDYTFALLGMMAGIDGYVDESEIHTIERFIGEYLSLSSEEHDYAMEIVDLASKSPEQYVKCAEFIDAAASGHQGIKNIILDILLKISLADGSYDLEEEELVARVAEIFGIEQSELDGLQALYATAAGSSLPDVEEKRAFILGCSPSTSPAELKVRYEHLVSVYNPDKALEAGLPAEFVNVVRKRFEDIEEAYALLLAVRA